MIEHALLKYLGIYPETIERADEIVERVCEQYGIDSDSEVWEYVKQTFDEEVFDGQLSDFVVGLMFRNLAAALEESGKVDGKRIGYYVNGICSDFTIDGDAVCAIRQEYLVLATRARRAPDDSGGELDIRNLAGDGLRRAARPPLVTGGGDMKSYHEIMAEPLPSSLDFGFDGNAADLAAESVRFGSTRGYVEFQIALCEWQMRRDCAASAPTRETRIRVRGVGAAQHPVGYQGRAGAVAQVQARARGDDRMTTWTCYENGIEGVYDLMRMLWTYMFTVDKDEYPDFGCWLWDMERSATFYRH